MRSPIYPFTPDPVVAALVATMGMAWVLRAPRKVHGPREDDPEMAPDVACTGCYDHSCPTCGCPKEKFTTPRQRAEENLKAGNIFDVPEDEWEREAAGYRAILAAEDAK